MNAKKTGNAKRRWPVGLALLLATALPPGLARAADPAQADPRPMLQLAERLLDEAERQHMVKHRMDTTVESFRRLVDDLKSNDLFREGRGDRMDKSDRTLTDLKTANVPAAARYLEQARKQIAQLDPNLDAAEGEIRIILRRLAELAERADASATDALLNELRLLIDRQQTVRNTTRRWGRELFQAPAKAEPQRQPLANEQKQIDRGLDQFKQHLADQARKTADPEKRRAMERAAQAAEKKDTARKIDSATRNIQTSKPVQALQDQDKVLEDLRDLESMLKGDDSTNLAKMKELRDRLKDLLQRQTGLRQKTEKTPEKDFSAEKKDLQVEQRKLGNELNQTRKDAQSDQSLPAQAARPLQDAQKDMAQAEESMQQDQRDPATASQKKAEADLAKAVKALDQEIARADEQADEQTDPLDQAAQAVQDLAEKQKELAQETARSKPEDVKNLQQPQQDLGEQARQLAQENTPAQQALEQAAGEMQQAAQQMQQAGQPDADAQAQQQAQQSAQQYQQAALAALAQASRQIQQAQAAQRLAEAAQQARALAQAQHELTEQTSRSDEQGMRELSDEQGELGEQAKAIGEQNPEAGRHLGQASRHMQQAAQHMGQGEQQQAHQSQQAAEQALAQAASALAQAARQHPGHAAYMSMSLDPGEVGSREFGQERSAGTDPKKSRARWTAMTPRQRDALYQNYARQLPMEYRKLLEDYYDALSK